MKNRALIISMGLAMFSMFFGSGNLVFPIVVGQASAGHYGVATLGILLTGVLVPFLGIFAMFLFKGDSRKFFETLGKPATFWFPLIALSLMGPFGVLARCITVSHGAFRLLFPSIPLWLFSAAFCLILFPLTIRKNRIVPILGPILTPFLIAALAAITFFGIGSLDHLPTAALEGGWKSFKNGIFQGYQTMDLLAAFFFSAFAMKHLQDRHGLEKEGSILPIFFKSALLGAVLLGLIYFSLVLLGAIYASELAITPPQEMLGTIAEKALGPWAALAVCTAVILACLTTAIVLASLFADFLRKEISKERIGSFLALGVTLAIAFCISSLEFSGISRFLGPILEMSYPALIVLTIVAIFHKLWGWQPIRLPVTIALFLKLLSRAL